MNKKFLYTILSLLLVGGLFSFHNEEIETLSIGAAAPMTDAKMKSIDGNDYALKDLAGENGLVVVFSCNTCQFVIGSSSFSGWEKVYNEYAEMAKNQKMGFVLINSNEAKRAAGDSFKDMKQRAKEKGYTMPYVIDNNSALANAFGAKTTPHVFLLNKEMNLVYRGSIDNTYDSKRSSDETYLKNAIEQLASGRDIQETSTPPRGCSIKRVHKH